MIMSIRLCGLVFLLVCFTFSDWGLAQDATGRIEGTLRDPQGAVVPNAGITLTHLGTGAEKSAKSDSTGSFNFVVLPIGQYRLAVDVANFARYVREPLTLNVNDVLRLAIDLKLGTTQEVIQITSDAPLVEVVSNSLGKVTSGREIVDLPLNGRNFTQLGLLQAGAAPLTQGLAQAGGSLRQGHAYSINGMRPESNNFLIDGARNINNVDTGFALKPPIDSIAEFRIITSGASAEFGESLGSNTNLVMKSGSNAIHGSVYEFFRNDVFDARNFFSKDVEPLKQNQFGATVGGPLKKDKTFFFGYYEGFPQSSREHPDNGCSQRPGTPRRLFSVGGCHRASPAAHQLLVRSTGARKPYPVRTNQSSVEEHS